MCCAQSVISNPFSGNQQAAEMGRGQFRIYCAPCHGIRAAGGRGPDLTRGVFSAGERDFDLHRVISEGVPGTEMPSFALNLGDENIWKLVTYIRSIKRPETGEIPGNAAAGEKLFWEKGGCGQCHMVHTKGGRMGPDLTRIGRLRSAAYLRESVISPNSDLTPGFYTITVVTKDGKKIVGVQRGLDNFSVQFMDFEEKLHSYLRSDVQSVNREFRSLMPENYGRVFSETELNDLLKYLVSLRGESKT